jgi:hypothetical protein
MSVVSAVLMSAMSVAFILSAPATTAAAATSPPQPPDLEIEQDGRMIEVVWHTMRSQGATKFGYKIKGIDQTFKIKGSTKKPQIKLVANDGERYKIWFRAYYPGYGWSAWTPQTRVVAPATEAHPWTVQVSAANRSLLMSWADVGADHYRWEVWDGSQVVQSGTVNQTQATATYLSNGTTYRVTVQASYNGTYTPRTPALPATPNSGAPVFVALRDYEIEDPTGPVVIEVPTAVIDATSRVTAVSVELKATDYSSISADATYDHYASATSGISGAWVSTPITVGPLDYEVLATASDGNGAVVASSLQTWLLGKVDEFTPDASVITRIGTYR